ncbi:acyltransferase [Lactobacillus sp. UCMA15818]|uniref:acyltransferase n=1 Tax=Lactobacillus sp. UCMA15818 TaxID=2583394 RepID=UPI0025AF6E55|nr:acyltransferase [Lactobacillus sp. UCMA15818]MDN2452255.1 acyltransferase [Lactobacillus sp. UCMA15818]
MKKKYLYEVDLMRCIFIFGVLANHVTSAFIASLSTNSIPQLVLLMTHLLLHFTRMGFMFVTGLVLFLQYYKKEQVNYLTFWYKRYKGSGVPYLFWNGFFLIFVAIAAGTGLSFSSWAAAWYSALIHGNQFYMYYILVTFQLYLIFPLLIKFFKKFTNYHLLIFSISALIQLFFLIWTKYIYPEMNHDNWPYLLKYYGNFVLSYQFYFIAGGFVSIHYDEAKVFILRYRKIVYSLTALLGLGTLVLFYFNWYVLKLGQHYTELVHQPYLMIYASLMICTVWCLSLSYASHRTKPRWKKFAKFVSLSSKLSFGVYLTQTIGLTLLAYILLNIKGYLNEWILFLLLPVGYLVVLGTSWLVSFILYKVPPFGILIGRPQKFRRNR